MVGWFGDNGSIRDGHTRSASSHTGSDTGLPRPAIRWWPSVISGAAPGLSGSRPGRDSSGRRVAGAASTLLWSRIMSDSGVSRSLMRLSPPLVPSPQASIHWVFQAHGADATGRVVFRKRLVRAKVLEFFAGQQLG